MKNLEIVNFVNENSWNLVEYSNDYFEEFLRTHRPPLPPFDKFSEPLSKLEVEQVATCLLSNVW